jgi:Icc-related predicted phosphoesterase
MTNPGTVRIAALADLHFSKNDRGSLQPLATTIGQNADVLLLCGDLTHHGRVAEAEALVQEFSAVRIPLIAVLGNHDFHGGEEAAIEAVLEGAGMRVLDGDIVEVGPVGFAGVKGFAGGFGHHVLEPWGEAIIKTLVHETVNEALKLETALARIRAPHKIVLLHYAPIPETVEGEPLQIYPLLGSSRLEDPVNRFHVDAVFHGHAHHGRPEGRTSQGIPVYNVSIPLLRRLAPDAPPFRVIELAPVEPAES